MKLVCEPVWPGFDELAQVLAALEAVGAQPRRTPSGWVCRCPHPDHQDDTPSAALRAGRTQPWIFFCHACAPDPRDRRRWLGEVVARLRAGNPLAEAVPSHGSSGASGAGSGFPVAAYDYREGSGRLVARKIRYVSVDGRHKSFAWCRPYGHAMVFGLGRTPLSALPLYGLSSMSDNGLVYVVEGEKDADRLQTLGVAAVTSAGGANRNPLAVVLPDDVAPLWGRSVVIVADRDPAGTGYARAWYERLRGTAADLRLARAAVEWPAADISDHLDAGLDLDELEFDPRG